MKNMLVLLVSFMFAFAVRATTYNEDQLIDAIAYVESQYNENAVSSDGRCVGYLQIQTIVVRECNRIIGQRTYNAKDRYSKEKSIEMFRIIQGFYNPKHDLVSAIRLWNEGPSFRKHPNRTTKYLRKVLARYNAATSRND